MFARILKHFGFVAMWWNNMQRLFIVSFRVHISWTFNKSNMFMLLFFLGGGFLFNKIQCLFAFLFDSWTRKTLFHISGQFLARRENSVDDSIQIRKAFKSGIVQNDFTIDCCLFVCLLAYFSSSTISKLKTSTIERKLASSTVQIERGQKKIKWIQIYQH